VLFIGGAEDARGTGIREVVVDWDARLQREDLSWWDGQQLRIALPVARCDMRAEQTLSLLPEYYSVYHAPGVARFSRARWMNARGVQSWGSAQHCGLRSGQKRRSHELAGTLAN
jgi:hypothetical protein